MSVDDAAGPIVTALPHGAVLVRHAFPPREQQALVAACFACHSPAHWDAKAGDLDPDSGRRYTQLSLHNWPRRYMSAAPGDVIADPGATAPILAAAAALLAGLPTDAVAGFEADSLRAIAYPPGGNLLPHTDMYMGRTLSVSLGASCEFGFGTAFDTATGGIADPVTSLRLDSGDAVLFDGQKLPHVVSKIHPDSQPDWWPTAGPPTLLSRAARINFQIRDCGVIERYGK